MYRRTSRKPMKRTSRGLRGNGLFTTGPVGERLIFDIQMDTTRSPGMKRYTRDQYVRHLWETALDFLATVENRLNEAERSHASLKDVEHTRLVFQRNALSYLIAAERMDAEAHALSKLKDASGRVYRGGDTLSKEYWRAYKKLAKRWPLLPQD